MAEEIKEEIEEEVTAEETEDQTEDVATAEEPAEGTVTEVTEVTSPEYPTVSLTLADGTVLADLKVNGDNFISETDIIDKLTPANLVKIAIDGGELGAMKLAGYREYPDGYHFVLIEKKQSELEIERLSAKLEYVAIMTDVEVD